MGISLSEYPPPSAFGLPGAFEEWRPYQVESWQAILDAPTRFVGMVAPTGAGKSLIYMAAIEVRKEDRGVVVTGGKGLQDQLSMDFHSLVDVRGQANYPCRAFGPGGEWQALAPEGVAEGGCQNGPCHVGLQCTLREAGCAFYDQVRLATEGQRVLTNYSFHLAQKRYSVGLGVPGLLVLDEAHVAVDELSNALQIKLERWLMKAMSLTPPAGIEGGGVVDWQKWAMYHADQMKTKLDHSVTGKSANEMKYRKRMQQVEKTLRLMAGMTVGDWVEDHTPEALVFECLNPAQYAEALLFQGAKKVVLTSATLTHKTLTLLGIPPDQITMVEYPVAFPVERRPVVWVPTVKMHYKMTDSQRAQWVTRIDQILDSRYNVKGIIHTVSYQRAKMLVAMSQHKSRLVLPPVGATQTMVEQFRKSKEAGLVLVSPAVMTGWDFPGDQCRFQIIGKLPFPDTRSKIVQARQEVDKDYGAYVMMQQLVQAVGRGMRSEDDWCENIVIDDQIAWVSNKYKKFAPNWFWSAYRKSITVPKPLQF